MELEFELSGVVQRFRNDKPVFTVGRGPGNDLVILDGSVSGKHARITDAPDLASVEDVGSTNGTYLNGEQIKGRGNFSAGDRLMFGRVVVKVLTIGPPRPAAPPAAPAPPREDRTNRYVPPASSPAAPGGATGPDEAASGLQLPMNQELLLMPGAQLAVPEARLAMFIRGLPRLAEARRAPEVLDRLAFLAQETVRADLIAIYMVDARGALVRVRASLREGSTLTQPDPSNSHATLGAAGQILQGGSAVYTARPEAPSGHRGLHVPLIFGPRRLGLVSAWVPQPPVGADLRLLGVLANQATAAYEALRAASVEVASVLDGLSGELRQPLAALQGTLQMPPEHIAAYVEYAVNEIGELAEVEAGRAAPTTQAFDVNVVLAEVQQYQASDAQQKGVRFTLEPPPGPLGLSSDPKRLAQLLHHQVGGAIKLAPSGSDVYLSLRVEGKRVRFVTWDPAAPEMHVGVDVGLTRRLAGLLGGDLVISGSAADGTEQVVSLAL